MDPEETQRLGRDEDFEDPSQQPSRVSGLLTFTFYTILAVSIIFLTNLHRPERHNTLVELDNTVSSISKPKLTLSPSNTFHLVIFADLHYGEEEHGWGIEQDIKSARVMRAVLDKEKSDLIVLNGDLTTGENTFRENASDYIHTVVAPLVERNLPWASTYGNHDSKFNLSREASFKIESAYPLSYTQRMDPSLPGITNYYLLVYRNDGHKPAAILWFFDSRGGASYQHSPANVDDIPNWVGPETTSWFTSTSHALRSQYGHLPSLAFVHIPPHPFLTAQRKGIDKALFPGVNDDVPVAIQGDGEEDADFVRALKHERGLHSVYVGHDHGNAWCSVWPEKGTFRHREPEKSEDGGPFLCFSKHTG